MKFETDQERLVRKIIEWTESLTEEEIEEILKDKEDGTEQ